MSVRQRHPSRPGTDETAPSVPVPRSESQPMLLGFPAEYADDGSERPPANTSGGAPTMRLVVVRRADPAAAAALVLAGVGASVSLWVPWLRGEDAIGFTLVRRGVEDAASGIDALVAGGLWPPLAVVLGGALLLLLGLLLIRPARTHRLVGVLELLVAAVSVAGVLVLLSRAGWHVGGFDIGAWCAVGVAGLGLLGALKAVLTTPRVVLEHA